MLSTGIWGLNFPSPIFLSPTQVIDVGSGKGYLSSFLSLQYGLQVYGIDSSSTNTHGAQERNRKLKRFSRAYQQRAKAGKPPEEATRSPQEEPVGPKPRPGGNADSEGIVSRREEKASTASSDSIPAVGRHPEPDLGTEELFLSALSVDASARVPRAQLSAEERERRKRENLERKALSRQAGAGALFSPLTSHVTAATELRELIGELEVRGCEGRE